VNRARTGTLKPYLPTFAFILFDLVASCGPATREATSREWVPSKTVTRGAGHSDVQATVAVQVTSTSNADDETKELEKCPDPSGEPSNDSPSYVVDDLGELYEACVADYLDVFGQFDQPIVDIGLKQRRRALCAALGREGYAVFERAQSGKGLQIRSSENCVGSEKQEFRMGRIIWEFSKLPNDKYLATRTARTGSPWGLMYQGHHIDTSLDGSFIITIVGSEAWSCPHDPTDPCDLFYADEDNPEPPGEMRCALDQETRCAPAGLTSEVYLTDYTTGATAHFGGFYRRPRPTVRINATQVEVTAGDCKQTLQLPLVAAKPQ